MKAPAHPLIERAENVRLSSASIEAFAPELPAGRESLEGLLEAAVAGYFGRAFTIIALSMLHRGLPFPAHHLVEGARLLPDPGVVGKIALNAHGVVVAALFGACEDGRLSWEREAPTLLLAAHLSAEEGDDTHRDALVRRARMLARTAVGEEAFMLVTAAAERIGDDELDALRPFRRVGALVPIIENWQRNFLAFLERPLLEGIAEEDTLDLHVTRRRAVDRVGRNEPCPCGSGKKYKRCCLNKDHERLQDSSDIAGVTRAELRRNLADHLSFDRIASARSFELARLDITRIDPQFHASVLGKLITFQEFDALRSMFRSLPPDALEPTISDAVNEALRAGKADKARAFIELVPEPEANWVGFLPRWLAMNSNSSPALDLLEEELSLQVDEAAVDVAQDLMRSRWPNVGLMLARGVAPLAESWEKPMLFEELGVTRDRLGLSAIDPTEGLEDLWEWSSGPDLFEDMPLRSETTKQGATSRDGGGDGGGDGDGEDEARKALESKEAELAKLRDELSSLRERLEERAEPEREDRRLEQPQAEDPRVKELRSRVARLRGELSERHTERNQLRRRLEQTVKRMDALEAARASADSEDVGSEAADAEDSESFDDAPVSLSFRLPVFTRRFRHRVEGLPEPVRRRAVVTASRIAAGDEAAFSGTKRLKRDRNLYRQRVGRDYRLIFRMKGDDELEALDIVARKDLERTIRELAGT